MRAHDVGEQAQRALRAGGDPARGQREHQRLRIHADVGRLARAEILVHEDEDGVRRVETGVIAHIGHLAADEVAPLDAHRAVKLLRRVDLPLAMHAGEFADRPRKSGLIG